MKISLVALILMFTQLAQADALANALESGKASCGLAFTNVNPNDLASKNDFPGVRYSPMPSTNFTVVGEYHFYQKGALECGRAAAQLVKDPSASVACVMSLGVHMPK